MTIAFRPMVAADRQFVLSGWSSSLRTSVYAGLIRNSTWAEVMHREIGAIIDAPTTVVTVACEPGERDHEDREFLYGFIAARMPHAGRQPYVYYVYVKKAYRYPSTIKLGRRLFAAAGIDLAAPFTFAARTAIGDRLLSMCACGRPRYEHGDRGFIVTIDADARRGILGTRAVPPCDGYAPKCPGATWDPIPAREDTP